jgi:uncharacterized membrane protein YcaP (DUF421 family)
MWKNLVDISISPSNLIIRAVLVYFSVVILLRISGKRQLGQMGATDLVAILLISNAVQNSMNGGDNSLLGGLLLAAVLIILSTTISYLTYKSKFFSKVFEGVPTLLIHNGKLVHQNLNKERLNDYELRALLRKQSVRDASHVQTAILEADGTLSIVLMEPGKSPDPTVKI